ncbi:hypothetical protein BDW02DRAFT_191332 [Decorospora gaudefroyi]|uniref:DUF676 domain-containing protein n=1 Tax=Decorospora gaudefroyi TaxID=184978 RepID=A0A6A5K3Z0_9PLEO|nr:hypothetical protein BDW02DRAFT_191332 [Decorospora gaudefroyi]
MTTKIAFRIQGIPLSWAWADLSAAVDGICGWNEAEHLSVIGTLNKAAECNVRSQVAVVHFDSKLPPFLSHVLSDETGQTTECKQLQDGTVLVFDRNFWGLTALSGPKNDDDVSIDIVAVTGLDGNAYGSWASRKAKTMWLRDCLPRDLPNCRVLTFGYNTKLSLDSNYRLDHFCNDLRHALRRSRPSEEASSRPLVLFGHSYGARLITRCLWQCKLSDDPAFQAILKWTRAVVFFGAVHRGMETDDIQQYLKSNFPESTGRLRIVEDLRAHNESALMDLQNFVNLAPRFLVISIHETSKAKTLVNTSVDSNPETAATQSKHGVWRRVGKLYTPVDEASAVIGLPSNIEIAIPSNSDHSNIAKFDSPTDSVYQELLYHIKAVQAQFLLTFPSLASLLQTGVIPAAETRAPSVAVVYQQRIIQTDENHGLIEKQEGFPRIPSLLRLATSLLEEIRSTAIFGAADIALLDETDAAARVARHMLGLLSTQRHGFPENKHASRRIFASVLQIRQSLIAIIELLDPLTHDFDAEEHERVSLRHEELPPATRQVLAESTQSLNATNMEIRTMLQDVQVSKTQHLHTFTAPKSEEGAIRIATAWSRYLATSQDKVEWISPECVYFPVGSYTEADRDSEGWVQRVLRLFTKAEAKRLKLRPRRFGVVDHNELQEKVI